MLALATASLLPATLSAHSHHAKLPAQPGHVAIREIRSAHAQHPQPATLRSAPKGSSRRDKRSGTEHRPGKRVTSSPPLPRTGRATRRALISAKVNTRRSRLRSREARSSSERELRSVAELNSPAQPTPVVNVIRPTSDRPQLPTVQQAATQPTILPTLYNDRGRLVVPAPLLGSHEILLRQNELADQDGLGRVQDDADLDAMRQKAMLVAIPASEALRIDDRLPLNRRFCRPWTAQFLATIARAHYERFHTPLQVNSAVRTVEFQVRLQRTNGNAAPAEGDTASPHLTGQAIDIAKRGLSLAEIAWLRGYLLPLIQESRADVEEEFQQSCFHISVYRRYLPPDAAPPRYLVTSRSTSALAVAIH